MTGFILKLIAVITMVLDHIKYAVPATDCFLTKYFGRISFPIFAFLVTEGWIHTRSRKKYFIRMIIFALISQIPFMLFRTLVADKFLLNIMFTFILGILAIMSIDFAKEHTEIPSIFRFFSVFVITRHNDIFRIFNTSRL